jgi:hypothetical protein
MADVTLTFTDKELRILQYLLSGTSNSKLLLEQMNDKFREQYENLNSASKLEIEDIETLQEAINHLSYLDGRWGIKSFLDEFAASNPELFQELVEFVFLPARKRKGYTFDKDTRSALGEYAAQNGLYIPTVIEHYFKLYAKNGSRESRQRIGRWMELDIVKKHKDLLMILANSSIPQVQIDAISFADKSMLGFLVNVKNDMAKWYLDKTMSNPGWYGKMALENTIKLREDRGWSPLTKKEEKYILNSNPSYYELSHIYKQETGQLPKRR